LEAGILNFTDFQPKLFSICS